jgi:hypothetical protein
MLLVFTNVTGSWANENPLSISQKRYTIFINFKMQIQETNDHIYSNPKEIDYNSKMWKIMRMQEVKCQK